MKALIDGDLITFRAAFTAEDDELWVAIARTDALIDDILVATKANEYEIWLSGQDNFRYKVYPEYKANRKEQRRPKWESQVKAHLEIQWSVNKTTGCEADDMLGVRQCELNPNCILVSIDKDMKMIPGKHYNFVKKELYEINDFEAIKFFYTQLLVGDTIDNIKGVPGIGPKKAEKLLAGAETEADLFRVVQDTYGLDEELEMNASCLWIWRKPNDIWTIKTHAPPVS